MAQQSSSSLKTIEVTGHSQGPKSTHIEADQAEFVIGKEASPLDYFLGSLAGCINVIGHLVAKDHGFVIDDLDIQVAGEIDPTKYKGETSEPRAGFQVVRVDVDLAADIDEAGRQKWMNAVAERCPVADNLRNATTFEVNVGAP